MANESPSPPAPLPEWLQFPIAVLSACWKPVLSIVGVITLIRQSHKLYLEDQRAITWISAVVILVILILILLIISFSKKQDGDLKQLRYPKGCRWARVGLLPVAIFTLVGASRVVKSHRDSGENVILVLADVDNAKPDVSRAVEGLSGRLKQEAPEKILVRQPGTTVRDQHEARALGEQYGGTVVIWFRTESQNGQDRIVVELESLNQSNKITGGQAGVQTVSNSETTISYDQIEGRALYIAGLAKYEAEQYDKAIALFTEALKKGDWQRDPVGVGYLSFLRGNCFYFSGNLREAIEDYSKAMEGNPGLAQAYFNRGLAHSDQKKDEEAVLDYTQAILLYAETDAGAYNNRGLSYIELANSKTDRNFYELAIRDFDAAVRINPQYAEAYAARGDAHSLIAVGLSETEENSKAERRTYFNRALADYSKTIDLKPSYAPAYSGRADTYIVLGFYDRAVADCTSAVQLDPNYAPAYYNRGLAFYKKGQFRLAVDDYTRAIALDANDSDFLYNRAAAYFELGKAEINNDYYKRALDDYNTILSRWSNITQAYVNRGQTLKRLGRCSEANKDFKRALDSGDAEIRKQAQDGFRESNKCEGEQGAG